MEAWREAAKQALPAPVLARIQAARWSLRRFRHRLRYLASGGRLPGVGLGRFDGRLVAYRIHSVDTAVLHHSFDGDRFLAAIPDAAIEESSIVLDVGAHIGTFALLASERARRGRVYAVEASGDTFELLRANVALSGRTNIIAEHLAMAGADGPVRLYHDPAGNYGHTITRPLSAAGEIVNGTTLTRYLDERGIGDVAVAKFNCEGAEFPVLLATAPDVLRRMHHLIVLYHCDLVDRPLSALLSHLQSAGLTLATRAESAERGWIIARRR